MAAPANALPPEPINPSDDEISSSEDLAGMTAAEVGRLSGLVAKTEGEIERLKNDLELKAELANKAVVDLDLAKDDVVIAEGKAVEAASAAEASQTAIDVATDKAEQFAAESFMQGSTLGSVSALLDSASVTDLLERQQMIDAISGSQLDVIGNLQRARVDKANLDAAARQAVDDTTAAKEAATQAAAAAQKAQQDASDARSAGDERLTALNAQLVEQQIQHEAAVNTVALLKDQRAQYDQWVELKRQEEERLRLEAEERARQAAAAAAAKLAAQQAAADAAAQAEADRVAAAAAEADRVAAAAAERAAVAAAAKVKAAERAKVLAAERAKAAEKLRLAKIAAAKAEAAQEAAEQAERAARVKKAAAAKQELERKQAAAAREAARLAKARMERAQAEQDALDAKQAAQAEVDAALAAAEGDPYDFDPNEPTPTTEEEEPAVPVTPTPTTPTVPDPPVTPPSTGGGSRGDIIVNAALKWLGTTYAWGGGNASGPTYGIRDYGTADAYGDYMKIGFDCSGLALYAYAQIGVYLPHYSAYQFQQGQKIAQSDLQKGDLVFYANNTSDPATIHHVAIYVGDGTMIEAPQSGSVVKISPMRWSGYIGASRPGT